MMEHAEIATYVQNRELSWLKFNERVLHEANRVETPLLERLKFISIFTTNLDEFFMIRVGTLTDYALLGKEYIDNKTDMTAREQLREIFSAVAPLYALREKAFTSVMYELSRHDVRLLRMQDLNSKELKALENHFKDNIMPLLSPQIIGSRHPFPHLVNKQLYVAVMLERKKNPLFGLVAIPADMDRIVPLGNDSRFVLLEDIVQHFAGDIFSIYKVLDKNIIAVTRNSDIDMDEEFLDEGMDYRLHMKNILKKRQRLSPVRLELMNPARKELLAFFCERLSLRAEQVFYSAAPLDLSFCFTLNRLIDGELLRRLSWSAHVPVELLSGGKKVNLLKHFTSGKDLLFSLPFESISPFLSLVHDAAGDSSVLSIKITLYRIDLQSRLAESLIHAVENGKEVIVLMELRARFDESNNIEWANRLEEAGCRVIYGLAGFKVHSKVCLITRKDLGSIQYITQIGTGNYNEKTAKQYTDLSLITADQEIGRDAANFFSNLLIENLEGEYSQLWVAPNSFKSNFLQCVESERQKALSGDGGAIIIKCNSITDKDVIEKLAEASRDGVKISMIVRGICCLTPQVADATDNIRVISIVGKFLEHSRIFCFGTGSEAKIYISSADLMTRNTVRRIEVACPILDYDLKGRIMSMLDTMLRDNTQAWEQSSDGRYVLRQPPGSDLRINSQEILAQEARISAIRADSGKSAGQGQSAGLPVLKRALRFIKQMFR